MSSRREKFTWSACQCETGFFTGLFSSTRERMAPAGSRRLGPDQTATCLELDSYPAVERAGPAAAHEDRQRNQAPQQGELVAAVEPGEAVRPVVHEGDDRHLYRHRRREEAREQAGSDREPADELDEDQE